MEREFNVNRYVKVKLTKKGRELHRSYYAALLIKLGDAAYPYVAPKDDADGWSRWQMWELMHIFGTHFYNGCDVPFETTIKIEFPEQEAPCSAAPSP